MLQHNFRLSLATQGVLLTILPGVVQVFVVATLALFLAYEQQACVQEARSRNILLRLGLFDKEAADAIPPTILTGESRGLLSPALAESALDKIRARAKDIESNSDLDAQQIPNAKELGAQSRAVVAACENLLAQASPQLSSSRLLELEKAILKATTDTTVVSKKMADMEDRKLKDLITVREEFRGAVRIGLLVALVSSVISGLFAAYVFNTSIVRKIEALCANALKISRREPLPPPLSGTTELAELDRLLHDTDRQLSTAIAREKDSFENSAQLIFVVDFQLRFKKLNPASFKLFGRTREELIGERLVSYIASSQLDLIETQFRDLMHEDASRSFECALLQPHGSPLPVMISACSSTSEQALYCVAIDITQRKRVEDLKQRFQMMLRNRISEPLSAVRRAAECIASGEFGPLPTTATDELQSIDSNLSRVVKLAASLDSLPALSDGQYASLDFTSVAVAALSDEARQSVAALARDQNVTIVCSGSLDTIIWCDKDQLVRVLTNLLSNAIKFSPRGAQIEIAATRTDTGNTRISVKDHGRGIPEAFVVSVFQPFVQVPEVGGAAGAENANPAPLVKGTGLGLSICASIVRAHGGTYGVTSLVGQGSNFWFEIPAVVVDGLAVQANL